MDDNTKPAKQDARDWEKEMGLGLVVTEDMEKELKMRHTKKSKPVARVLRIGPDSQGLHITCLSNNNKFSNCKYDEPSK